MASHNILTQRGQAPDASGVDEIERKQVEGLFPLPRDVLSRPSFKLAYEPNTAVARFQRLTTHKLLRTYPLSLRFSGANMDPLPAWLVGAQGVALNMCNNDLPIQLHFVLFNGADGYVLKPPEMRRARESSTDQCPPVRQFLHRATIDIISLHNLPKTGEQRPRLKGRRSGCHQWHAAELTGSFAPPDASIPSSPMITVSLHAIGGFCGIFRDLSIPPPPEEVAVFYKTAAVQNNGLNALFDESVHCVAAEPDATFMRIGVSDGDQEVVYETAVLGRLRRGYRVFRMRNAFGTRVELCYLLVHIEFGKEANNWIAPAALRLQAEKKNAELSSLAEHLEAARKAYENERLSAMMLRNIVARMTKRNASFARPYTKKCRAHLIGSGLDNSIALSKMDQETRERSSGEDATSHARLVPMTRWRLHLPTTPGASSHVGS